MAKKTVALRGEKPKPAAKVKSPEKTVAKTAESKETRSRVPRAEHVGEC